MAMSRAGQEGLTNYTPQEKTMGYAVKERIKSLVKPDKESVVDKIEVRNKKVEDQSRGD